MIHMLRQFLRSRQHINTFQPIWTRNHKETDFNGN